MQQWMQDLNEGWPMIRANIPTFLVIVALIAGGIWYVMNWRYGAVIAARDGIIANKDSEITLLKGQRDDYKDKLSGATPDQAKARIDALEERLARLEPRKLTEFQKSTLRRLLTQPVGSSFGVSIARDMACTDCAPLSADISAAFQGWNVSNPQVMGIGNPPPTGIAIRCADADSPSAQSRLVIAAMREAGIHFDLQNKGRRPQAPPGMPAEPEVEILITTSSIK